MKRIVLSVLAVSMLAATSLAGQAAPMNATVVPQSNYTKADWQKPGRHNDVRKRVFKKKVVVKRNHWRNGQKYSGWRQHQPIRDYGRYGLHRPGRGQEWIRVGNDYVLVGILSGVVFGALAAQ
ncbi:RcnB family protein [Mesorhizobium intechi]|uniref:RcnB family protein n=1 Tax=Mesorhizobium intechi TaxID=537601 RepID=UPI000CBBE601|nr:RcnB family protein [Mesorhizobium intechi]TSE12953.1 RcnB family protein [Mesorhizobium intechi]